uniref:Uncharacterized protein n=1 Tax=Candidatus Kentrum sp. LFY TaxID=2126342 RepID=A0A450V2X7_9GAMM|nr:MAG: hypothetical protein BECKLFY1418B_GA0070995_11356 [Candidatus Kentron sp. LFY]
MGFFPSFVDTLQYPGSKITLLPIMDSLLDDFLQKRFQGTISLFRQKRQFFLFPVRTEWK